MGNLSFKYPDRSSLTKNKDVVKVTNNQLVIWSKHILRVSLNHTSKSGTKFQLTIDRSIKYSSLRAWSSFVEGDEWQIRSQREAVVLKKFQNNTITTKPLQKWAVVVSEL